MVFSISGRHMSLVRARFLVFTGFFVWLASLYSVAQPFDRLQLAYTTRYGTATATFQSHNYVIDHTVDAQGYVYIVGYGFSAETTAGSYMPSSPAIAYGHAFVAKFNPTLTTMIWGSYLGGNYVDIGTSIAVNAAGEVLISGTTASSNFPVSVSSDVQYLCPNPSSALTHTACFVAKFSANGSQLQFCRVFARGSGSPYVYTANMGASTAHISVCAAYTLSGDIYASASASLNFHTTTNAYQTTAASALDLSLTKFNSTGDVLYSTYVGGNGVEDSRRICCAGNQVYLCGKTGSSNFPLAMNKSPDAADVFVMSWTDGSTPAPNATYIIGGSATDDCNGICYSAATNTVNVVGSTNSSNFPYTGTLQAGHTTGGFVASIHSGLNAVKYITMLGTDVRPYQIVARTNGDVYLIGSTTATSATVALTPTALRSSPQNLDWVINCIAADGSSLRYGTYFGGGSFERGTSLAIVESNACGFRLVAAGDQTASKYDFPYVSGAYKGNTCDCLNSAIVIFGNVHTDTLRTQPGINCGEYEFSSTVSPTPECPNYLLHWNFGDSSTVVSASTSIRHIFTRNGRYVVRLKIIYNGIDTVYRDTTLNVTSLPTVNVAPRTAYRCYSDSGSVLFASGATRYEWRPGTGLSDSTIANPVARPNQNTTYIVRGYSSSTCYAEDTVQVYVMRVKAVVSRDTVICAGERVTLKASGARDFQWSPSNGLNSTKGAEVIANPSQTTTYTVVVSEANCADTARVTVRVSRPPQTSPGPAAAICTGGSTRLGIVIVSKDSLDTLGMRYAWTPAATLDDPTSATPLAKPVKTTRYKCVLSNRFGCTRIDSVEVKVQASLDLKLSPDTLTCVGSTLILRASGGALYSWSPKDGLDDSTQASPRCTPNKDMVYTVMTWSGDFTNATCRDTAVVQVRVYAFPRVMAMGAQTVCKNTSVRLYSSIDSSSAPRVGLQRVWRNLSGTILGQSDSIDVVVDTTSRFIVSLSNAQGCVSSDTVEVTVANALVVQANAVLAVQTGSNVKLSVRNPLPGVLYRWYDSSGKQLSNTDTANVVVNSSAWYRVYAVKGGCEGWDSVFVELRDMVRVQASQDIALCKGQRASLRVLNPQLNTVYTWTAEQSSWTASGDSVGVIAERTQNYVVRAQQGALTSDDTVFVTVYDLPQFVARDTTLCEGEAVVLGVDESKVPSTYIWRDEAGRVVSTLPTFSTIAVAAHSYTIQATSAQGCSSTDTLLMSVNQNNKIVFSVGDLDTLMPSTFVEIPVYALASHAQTQVRLHAKLSLPKSMLTSPLASIIGDELVFTIDTLLDLQTSPTVVARLSAQVLLSAVRHSAITLHDLSSGNESLCSVLSATPGDIDIYAVCGNTWFQLEGVASVLYAYPNPSEGELTIVSSSDVKLFDALGHERDLSVGLKSREDGLQQIRLPDLPAGVYLVHMNSGGEVLSKSIVVCK